jgi:hypothetical protein
VAGIELSEPMVAQLRRKVDESAVPVVVGDMAWARVPGEFALVYLVFNTIGNLCSQDEQVACFANAARHLAPGGRFVVEVGVPRLRSLPPGQVAVPFAVRDDYLGLDTYDVVTQRAVSHHLTVEADGSYRRGTHHFRYVWPAELDLMARLAGLDLERRVADWHGRPFTADSPSHVSIWRRPGIASPAAPGRLHPGRTHPQRRTSDPVDDAVLGGAPPPDHGGPDAVAPSPSAVVPSTGSRSRVRSGEHHPNTAASRPTETTATSAGRSPTSPAKALATSAPPVQPTPNDSIRPAVFTRPSMCSGVTCWR